MRELARIALFSTLLPSAVQAEQPFFEEFAPSLLVVDVTSVEDTGIGDGHAYWYLLDADVRKVIAGEVSQETIRFAVLATPGHDWVYPKQIVTLIDIEGSGRDESLGVRYEALALQRIDPIVCFTFEPQEMFPNDRRFMATVTVDSYLGSRDACYRSESLVGRENIADASASGSWCPFGKKSEAELADGITKRWCMREVESGVYTEVGRTVYVRDGVVIAEMTFDEMGKLNGLFQTRDESGSLTSRGYYRDGDKAGHWLEWDEETERVSEVFYPESGSPITQVE